MKKLLLFLLLSIFSLSFFAQKKEKIKGDKNVTTVMKNIEMDFNAIEISDEFKVKLIKSIENSYTLTTDKNLQDVIQFTVIGGLLKIYSTSNIVSSKKLDITLNFKNLEDISLREKAELKGENSFESNNININAQNSSKFDLEVRAKQATITMQNDAKGKLNLRSDKTAIVMTDKSNLNVSLNSDVTTASLSKSAKLELDGNSDKVAFTTSDSADLDAKKMKVSSAEVSTSGNSELHIDAKKNLDLQAKDKSKIFVYSEPKIDIKQFVDRAEIIKR